MLIIAPCSCTKFIATPPALQADAVRARSLTDYAEKWVDRVRAEKDTFLPEDIYAGQGMCAAREASEGLGATLHIISAGLSMVGPKRRIPSYNLTVGNDGPNPFDRLRVRAAPSEWWLSLNRAFGYGKPLARLIRSNDVRVLVAIPTSYMSMVEGELSNLPEKYRRHLRIITPANTILSSELSTFAIRYDQRLNHVVGAPHGANSSFVQRALLHFSRLLIDNPRIKSVKSQQELVSRSLGKFHERPLERRRMSDDEILRIIERTLEKKLISCSKMLDDLRHKKNIACEQKRFKSIYDDVMARA